MEPTALEIEIRRLCYFVDEVNGIKHSFGINSCGYTVPYSTSECTQELANKLTETLCSFLKKNGSLGYSLEMQIWWRDHQNKDKRREKAEKQKLKATKDKQKAPPWASLVDSLTISGINTTCN